MSVVTRHIFTATLFAALCPALGQAQSSSPDAVGSYYFDDDVSSEDGSATPSVAGSRQVDVEAECDCEVCSGSVADQADESDVWKLMDLFTDCCGHSCLEEKSISVAGWVEMGYQSQPDGAFTGNGPFLDDREWGNVNLNQLYLYSERIADGGDGCDWGYRVDLLYGVDGNEGQSFGNPPGTFDFLNGWDHGIYEWAMPQLYAEVAYEDLSVKLGHFYTPTGYEVVPPAGNFFFSRQITWYNGEPFTHTGALATYKANDKLTLTAGWALGWDSGFAQFNGGNMGLLGASYKFSEMLSLTYFGGYGNFGWRGSQGALTGLVASVKLTEKLSSVHQFDVLSTNNAEDPVAPGGNFAVDGVPGDNVALINYLFYDLDTKWRAGIRSEWYKADSVSYNTLSYGLNWKPRSNLLIRPEMRHLWAPGVPGGPSGTVANNVARVFDENDVFGIDAIWSF